MGKVRGRRWRRRRALGTCLASSASIPLLLRWWRLDAAVCVCEGCALSTPTALLSSFRAGSERPANCEQSGQTLTSPRVSPDPPGITAAPLWRLETNACRKKPVSYPQSAPGGLPSTTPSGTSSVTSASLSDCTQFVSIGRYGCIDEGHEDGLLEASAPHIFQSIFPGRLPSDPEPSSHPTVVQSISAPRLNLLPEDVRTWGKVPAMEAREKAVENLILPPLLRQNRSITCTRPSFVTGRVQMRNFEFGIDTEFQTAAEE
ncbi:hypothetical protein IQ07DRAFT_606070 [Pyrenochaeta sp. DS3sAY3a]|nr:hypothetical protein IQ07DRAFT_606070 [Pyrenochaeta sp. DS3sAY3a]